MENSGTTGNVTLNGMVSKITSCPYLLALVAGVGALAIFGKKRPVRRRRTKTSKKSAPKRRKRK